MTRNNDGLIERFIGAMTMAIGFATAIPRSEPSVYALFGSNSERAVALIVMLNFGCCIIGFSYLHRPIIRSVLLGLAMVLWGVLAWKFMAAQLWGVGLQSCVVIIFAGIALFRRVADHRQGINDDDQQPLYRSRR